MNRQRQIQRMMRNAKAGKRNNNTAECTIDLEDKKEELEVKEITGLYIK